MAEETTQAMLELVTDLVESHRRLTEAVAALHADVAELSARLLDPRDREEIRADARALRGQSAQIARQARRLVAEAEALRPDGLPS